MTISKSVLIVGVGNMGGGMAANLLAKGWNVLVDDVDAEKVENWVSKGAVAQSKQARIASDLIAVIVCVVDAAQTENVLFHEDGLAYRLQAGQTVILCPTILPQDVASFAARLADRGIHTIDAPMSGGPVRAADGTMSLMVACHRAVLLELAGALYFSAFWVIISRLE